MKNTELEPGQAVEGIVWTPEYAAEQVRIAYGRTVESVIELGQLLTEARERVGHGKWGQTVALLPFSDTTAKRYMRVAKNKVLVKSANLAVLPASVVALDYLIQLPNADLENLIAGGTVTASTTLEDARRLVVDHRESLEHDRRVREGMAVTPAEKAISHRAYDAATASGWEARHQAGREAVLAYREGGQDAADEVIARLEQAAAEVHAELEQAAAEVDAEHQADEDQAAEVDAEHQADEDQAAEVDAEHQADEDQADEDQAAEPELTEPPKAKGLLANYGPPVKVHHPPPKKADADQAVVSWLDYLAVKNELAEVTAERDELKAELAMLKKKLAVPAADEVKAALTKHLKL